MSVLKTFCKLMVLLVLGAVLTGVAFIIKRSSATGAVSFDQWPDVPQNPAE